MESGWLNKRWPYVVLMLDQCCAISFYNTQQPLDVETILG